MAILKQIKFENDIHQIAKTQVAVDSTNGSSALSVSSAHTEASDADDPVYTLSLAIDGKTIVTNNSSQLETALALKVEAASGEGSSAKKARIALVDSKGGSGYAELSSVNIEDIVGDGIVDDASYDSSTGELTITWAGSTQASPKKTVIDLGALLDIQDIIIKSDSAEYLSFAAVSPAPGTDAGQAQIGVKLADVTYTATAGSTKAKLSVDTTNGKMLDASDAIPAIKSYVNDVLAVSSATLAVTAEGDDYVRASVNAATDNKHVIVDSNVVALTASAGTPGVYGTDGSQTTAPTAGTLSGTANSLADGADIASKVKTYVDGAIAIEGARSDAKNLADIAALDVADAAVAGQFVSQVSETDGKIAVVRTDVSGAVLNNYAKGSDATAVAATDTINQAISKLENQVDAAKAAATTKVEKDAAASHLTLTSATAADGSVTYTVGENDIAAKTDLDAEIAARKAVDGQNGQTYAANANANYISNATSLNDADVKLDAALKTEETRATNAEKEIAGLVGLGGTEGSRTFTPTTNYGGSSASVAANMQALDTAIKAVADGIQYQVSGSTLEFFGVSQKSNS